MYIKTEATGTSKLTIRELDGDRLETPITVRFNEDGIARVKAGVGELLADRFDLISVHTREGDQEQDGAEDEQDEPEDGDQ